MYKFSGMKIVAIEKYYETQHLKRLCLLSDSTPNNSILSLISLLEYCVCYL